MSALRPRRRRLASRLLATAAIAVVAGALWPAVGGAGGQGGGAAGGWPAGSAAAVDLDTDLDEAVEHADDVQEARDELEEARAEAAAVAERLQQATAEYEEARAHRLRLEAEAAAVAETVDEATAAVDAAQAAFAEAAVVTYKRPGAAIEAGRAVLDAGTGRDALHRAALVGRLVAGERRHADQVARRRERAEEARRQHATVEAGVAGAAQQAEDAAAALEAAHRAARKHVEQAAVELEVTEEEVRERLEAEREAERRRLAARQRQRRQQQQASQASGRGRTVLPAAEAIDRMACPVGEPHSFIDSWHFPRSGGRVHKGVDIFAERGTPVRAVADGTVRRVWHNRLGGLSIGLVDDRGDRYYHAHLDAAHVTSGQRVEAGQHIADIGNSGNARHTPPHLHWQYHPGDGAPVNPYALAVALCR